MGSLVFLFIAVSFGQSYFHDIHGELLSLEKELENPQQNLEKFNRIHILSETDCARELSQLTGTKMGINENCQNRLWKASFRYLHYSQMEKLSKKLDQEMTSLPIHQMDEKKKSEILKEVRELKQLWSKVFGDRKE